MQGWTLFQGPFFDDAHRNLGEKVAAWRAPEIDEEASDLEPACRELAGVLGNAGLIDSLVPRIDAEGRWRIDVRALCIVREAVAYESPLADAVLAMQGIGTAALWQSGNAEQQERYLDGARSGRAIAAFALTEPDSGSDVANIATRAEKTGSAYILNGQKTLISNAPFADHYIVVARSGEAPGARGLTAFIIDKGTPGLLPGPPIALMAPHPLAPLDLENCRVPEANVIGEPGKGFAVAMATFDIFRTSVGAASVGMARRALDATIQRVKSRRLFGKRMSDVPGVQTKLAEMAIDLDTAALAVYQAAWAKDTTGGRCSREAAVAKYVGSEHASRIVDGAVQIFGGLGVTRGSIVEKLYREVRPTRIYEGASEVQKLVIARDLLADRN